MKFPFVPSKLGLVGLALCLGATTACINSNEEEVSSDVASADNAPSAEDDYNNLVFDLHFPKNGKVPETLGAITVHNAIRYLLAGTKEGPSKDKLLTLLQKNGSNQSITNYEESYRKLLEMKSGPLKVANRIYANKNKFTVLETADQYLKELTTEADVNQYVRDATKDTIKDLIPENTFDNRTQMVVVSAAHFLAKWKKSYCLKPGKDKNDENTFFEGGKDITECEINTKVYEDGDKKGIILDFARGEGEDQYQLVVIVPGCDKAKQGCDEKERVKNVFDSLIYDTQGTNDEGDPAFAGYYDITYLAVPNLDLSFNGDIQAALRDSSNQDVLQGLEFDNFFDEPAPASLQFFHKSTFKMNHQGASAIGATAVGASVRSLPQETEFVVDGPAHYFLIRQVQDDQTRPNSNIIVFTARSDIKIEKIEGNSTVDNGVDGDGLIGPFDGLD